MYYVITYVMQLFIMLCIIVCELCEVLLTLGICARDTVVVSCVNVCVCLCVCQSLFNAVLAATYLFYMLKIRCH